MSIAGPDDRETPPGSPTSDGTDAELNRDRADAELRDSETTATFSHDFGALISGLEAGISTEEQDAIRALPSGSALLIVRRGPNIGARFLLDADITIAGRHPNADIFLDDVTVSRRHAEFVRDGRRFAVRDLGSLNGTYYNGERVEGRALDDGAEVQVGKFRLTFYASRLDLGSAAAQ